MSSGTSVTPNGIADLSAPAEANVAEQPAEPAPPVEKSLRSRAIRGSAWLTGGYFSREAMRLASNLILAHLLMPEDFGLMALVTIFLQALQMFSDIGVGPSIIQNKRGETAPFLNTAWTIQICRGFFLWGVACLIAYPVSRVWGPALAILLPVAGINAVVQGFNSTRLFTLNRKLFMGRLTVIDLTTQLVGALVMVAWALFVSRSVWALVAGGLAGSMTRLVLSHCITPGPKHRLTFDRECYGEMFRFGRWLFLSTIITFFAGHVANLMYGALMTATAMGIYWTGYQFARLVPELMRMFEGKLGFPLLSDLYRRDPKLFRTRLAQLRKVTCLLALAGCAMTVLLGPSFIYLVYPAPYFGAGWVMQLIAINAMAGILNSTYGQAYMASGYTHFNTITVASQLTIMVVATLTGYYFAGQTGFLLGLGISQWVKYPVDAMLAKRGGYWQWRFDIAMMVLATAVALAMMAGSHGLLLLLGLTY